MQMVFHTTAAMGLLHVYTRVAILFPLIAASSKLVHVRPLLLPKGRTSAITDELSCGRHGSCTVYIEGCW